ncbi:MAG: hypothetical protein IPL17_07960, partial [Anaerolineales bacterium]|nr:hypothetical protein [Anaerolineales bacterium]
MNFSVLSVILVIAIARFKTNLRVLWSDSKYVQTLIAERSQLENKVRERTEELEAQTNQLRTSTTVARTIAEIQDVSMLLGAVTDQISEKFEYYHVGLYILDEQKKLHFCRQFLLHNRQTAYW